jgi:hypothetical protein
MSGVRRLKRFMLGTGDSIAGAIYGTIVVMATIVATGSSGKPDAWRIAAVVVATTFVLGVAHLYSETVARSIALGARLTTEERRRLVRQEFAIPLAAAVPVLMLVLGAAGVMPERTAIRVALAIGLVTLGVQGYRYARLQHDDGPSTAVSVGKSVGLGLLLVAVEVAVRH